MAKKPRGLFDEQERLEKLNRKSDPLKKLSSYIDFEFFRKPLEKGLGKNTDTSRGGRPAYDYVLMFKILVLQRYYNLSDDNTEYAILDRLSFMNFLGLRINDPVPDAKTIWLFRDRLSKEGLVEKLFKYLDKQLDQDGIVVNKGQIIDATVVEVPVQRNSRDENDQLKKGQTPVDWKQEKQRQKDTEAKWTQIRGRQYFGYKNHIKADAKSKIITGYVVTPANIHEKDAFDALTSKQEDGGQPMYADCSYRNKTVEQICADKTIKNMINEQSYRHKKLSKEQIKSNRLKSKVRSRIEHIFGFMTNSMNGIFLRARSKARIAVSVGLMNLTYNLFRLPQINVALMR